MREKIMNAAITVFNDKGVKFTIDDIASYLSISKKSVYKYFDSKEEIIDSVIELMFEDIERQHYEILALKDIDIVEKLKRILVVNPSMMKTGDNKLAKLKELYPESYKKIKKHFESNWELTLSVLDECRQLKLVKPVTDNVFKTILIGIFDTATDSDNYTAMVNECIYWLFEGIKVD